MESCRHGAIVWSANSSDGVLAKTGQFRISEKNSSSFLECLASEKVQVSVAFLRAGFDLFVEGYQREVGFVETLFKAEKLVVGDVEVTGDSSF